MKSSMGAHIQTRKPSAPNPPIDRREAGSGALFKGRLLICALLLAAGLFTFGGAAAQENFEIQVYPSETVAPGRTLVELHSNMAIRGTTEKKEGVFPTQGALHATFEITHGFTPWFETAFYLLTSMQPQTDWRWVGNHIRSKIRVPESWDWPVGLGLSAEFGYQERSFSTDTWTVEIRPIIDKKLKRWYFSFNPVLGRSLRGESTDRGLEFKPSFKVSYDISRRISGGLEYYGALGPLSGFDPLSMQQHQIFPAVDLNLGPDWKFNFGVGFGLTSSTDPRIIKMILGRRF